MENTSPIPFLRTRLFIQMFLQFAIWGAWAPVLPQHLSNLGFTPGESDLIMTTGPLATMISPLIAGQIVDRWFATQRFLAFAYMITAGLLWRAANVITPDFWTMWTLCFLGMIVFAPTLGLGNSLVFHHSKDSRADFPIIRLGGTLGWIASAWVVQQVMTALNLDLHVCLKVGSIAAFLNAFFCLTLPNTPPNRNTGDSFALAKLFRMFKDPSFVLFSILSFFLLVFATFYYFRTGVFFKTLGLPDAWLGPTQTIGQVAEIVTMLILPFAYKALGTKKTIALGLLAWTVRFAIFAIGSPAWLVIAAQSLHGVCFAFGLAAAMIYFERICDPDVRGSMQSFLSWITYGFGMFIGGILLSQVGKHYVTPDPANPANNITNWSGIWSVPAIGCGIILIVFLIGFKARDVTSEEPVPAELEPAV